MIPILYDKTEKEFRTLGIGPLSDAISCEVTEERNGSYELRMTYPITGVHYSDITNEAIICAIPADGKDAQPFRIYKISRPINGKISVYAEHLSYQLSHIVVMPFTAHGAGNTLSGLIDNSIGDQPFSVWTDIANGTTEYNQTVPASFRSRLGGVSGSVLDCFGGEYEFDQWTVKLHAHRGTDRGVSIEYGKNLVSVTQEENIANVVTGIVPMWKSNDGDTVVTLPEVMIESEYADRYTYKRNIVYDFSSDFQDQPTEEELRAKAESYVSSNLIGVPEVSIDVDFVALSDTEEYKDLERERINLCDTVTVRFAELGIDTTAKVVKTVYDVLGERYTKVSIGSVKASIVDTVNSIQQTQKEDSDTFKSFVASTLGKQKEIMTGGLGGHVIVNYVNGYPSEIVIGDTDNIKTMKHCIVINKNGIGFSDGYNADVSSAWTIDGRFSADYILTGTLNAARIKAGIISDLLGRNYWDLETGEFSLTGYATDDELRNGISDANTYADQQAQGALDTAKNYADTGDNSTYNNAKEYANNIASVEANNAVQSQTQQFIFDKLTGGGVTQGIYLQNGKIYINMEYLVSNIIKGLSIFGSTITFGDEGGQYRVQASYREATETIDGSYKPKGLYFETFDKDSSITFKADRILFLPYSNDTSSENMLWVTKDNYTQMRSNRNGHYAHVGVNADSDGSAYCMLQARYNGVDEICALSVNTSDGVIMTTDMDKHTFWYQKDDYSICLTSGFFNNIEWKVQYDSDGNVTTKTRRNNQLQACDGNGNVKSYLNLYSNGAVTLASNGQTLIRSNNSGNTFVQSIGGNVYLQSRGSDDADNNSYIYVRNDGSIALYGSGNNNIYLQGYPAVRVNGTYHDIFFQWNGASLIATVDVTQVWSTSDRRLKDQIEKISDDYIDAIGSAEIKQFIFTDEIYDKSIKHFGVIAQDVREALESKGINPEEIAVNNHFDRDGEEYYGIDKEEFLMARIAYDEKKIKELKNEISDLREQIKQIKELLKS